MVTSIPRACGRPDEVVIQRHLFTTKCQPSGLRCQDKTRSVALAFHLHIS